jgi:hypothetical protein
VDGWKLGICVRTAECSPSTPARGNRTRVSRGGDHLLSEAETRLGLVHAKLEA